MTNSLIRTSSTRTFAASILILSAFIEVVAAQQELPYRMYTEIRDVDTREVLDYHLDNSAAFKDSLDCVNFATSRMSEAFDPAIHRKIDIYQFAGYIRHHEHVHPSVIVLSCVEVSRERIMSDPLPPDYKRAKEFFIHGEIPQL